MALGNLIDKTYFIGDIALPSLNSSSVTTDLDTQITPLQEKILIDALGEHLYLELDSNYNTSTDDKWRDLVEGKTYESEYDGNVFNIRWAGLKNTKLISFLAYFAYCEIIKNKHLDQTGTGTVMNQNQNSKVVSPYPKIVSAFNKGLDLYGKPTISGYLRDSFEVAYSDYPVIQVTSKDTLRPTLYNYMNRMNYINGEDYYPNWIFTKKQHINNFMI